nr:immunoglobulin heavy chain junction region [Mus musculus]
CARWYYGSRSGVNYW